MEQKTYHQRLPLIRSHFGVSARQFAIKLGVDPSQYLKTEKGKYELSHEAAAELSSAYSVNLDWLFTGKGQMLQSSQSEVSDSNAFNESETTYQTSDGLNHAGVVTRSPFLLQSGADVESEVPYYDNDFIMGDGVAFDGEVGEKPSYLMRIQGFPHCIAFPTFGDSMESRIKSGSVVFARMIEWKDHLEYGQIYGIVMNDNRRYLKYIRRSPENHRTHFLLRSENEHYDDFEIPKTHIQKIWLIEGWIIRTH